MQDPQADKSSKSKKVGVDEQLIMFRSSPNFQGMKKFIMSKVDNTETSNRSSPNNQQDAPVASHMDSAVRIKPEVQGAADALDPNNADGSAAINVATKVENERDEYQAAAEGDSGEPFPRQETTAMTADYEASNNEQPGRKEPESTIMCRDFVRGTCKRPGTCRYAHKCDTSQLFGVYTFCRNFQNKICTLPNCKYVHASIFEEQEFYRTGKLPARVLTQKSLPPPPPPPDTPPEGRTEIPTNFSHPPPSITTSVEANPSVVVVHGNTPDPRIFREEFSQLVESDDGEPLNKKCRFQYHKGIIDKKREVVDELKRKSDDVERKKEKLSAILAGVVELTKNSPATAAPSALFNIINNDKSKGVLDHLAKLNPNNRVSVVGEEESNKSVLGEKYIASLIAKVLFEEQARRVDITRKD
ncbi:uncharacterized protein [Epargyreus clarus]|uniref:uncharacterized protein isoform X2 n=1 Tax=Epargyreus clarus TaxID=520877 RepID=UPI003C2C5715